MDWVSKAILFAFLLYIAYRLEKIPSKLDSWVRSFAVEYKRWADQDSLHDQVISEERRKSPAVSRRRLRRMEMNREYGANVFRGIDDDTLQQIERSNEEKLKELDELDRELAEHDKRE